jgi:hypothetical protein
MPLFCMSMHCDAHRLGARSCSAFVAALCNDCHQDVAAARRTGDATLLAAYEQTIKHSREVARTRAMQIGPKSARPKGWTAKKEGGED